VAGVSPSSGYPEPSRPPDSHALPSGLLTALVLGKRPSSLLRIGYGTTAREAGLGRSRLSSVASSASSRVAFALVRRLSLVLVLTAGAFLRLWQIDAVGYNTDEAVYAGQAAAIAQDPVLSQLFPVFRAHPLLFQFVLAVAFAFGVDDVVGRLVAVLVGLATVYLVYRLGKLLYGERAGLLAALFMALMPYHVIVTRQVLLDGPMTLCATVTLYMVARLGATHRAAWLYAAGAGMGLTFLAKETGIILLGSIYAFVALTPTLGVRLRDLAISMATMLLVIAPFPLSLALAGGGGAHRTEQYLVWQLLRRPNHDLAFYPSVLPPAIGPLLILAAVLGLWYLRRKRTWKETLLVSWIAVPLCFYELYPVKGFQYPIAISVPIAILAARALLRLPPLRIPRLLPARSFALAPGAVVLVALSLALASWSRVQFVPSRELLAGAGGVPGGRELGAWIRENVPEGAQLLTIGPSMANVVQFYGNRKAYGLSVSPNPLHRNPSYDPIPNPDLRIRYNELQYLVWDSFSASRSPFFAGKIRAYARAYHGRVVHTETVDVRTPDGGTVAEPIIIVYEVRP
jgi:4-amino-4-deoxy-L-arabinose transferase-like glycosyltransferase